MSKIKSPNPGPNCSERLYNIHRDCNEKSIAAGAGVFSTQHLFPPLESPQQSNNFNWLYEYVRGFGFNQNMTFELSKPTLQPALESGIPAIKSFFHHELDAMGEANIEIIDHDHPPAAPAATVQSFISDAIGTCLPDHSTWCHAYQQDPCNKMLAAMVKNPSLIESYDNMLQMHHIY